MRVEEMPASFSLGLGIGFDVRAVQAHGAVGQDREMIDVAIVNMDDYDLSF